MRWPDARHELVVAHFDGRTNAAQDRRMWRHLPGCEACRRRYRDFALLEALEPDADERARRRIGQALFAPTRRRFVLLAGLSLMGVAAGVMLLAGRLPGGHFGIRGRARPEVPSEARLEAYRMFPDGRGEALGGQISQGDGVAFTYINAAARPWRHLMVFAVDGAQRVYWYWPAWQQASADPVAIPITASATPVELREAIKHPFPVGRVTLFGLFTDRPYRVTEVEKVVALATDGAAPSLEGHLWTQTLEVSR